MPFPEVFDSSIMNNLKECPTKFWLGDCMDYKPKGTSVHLHAGGAFAVGVEATRRAFYIDGLDRESSIMKGTMALMKTYGDFEAPERGSGSSKTLDRMAGALVYYWDSYPLNHDSAFPIMLPGAKRGIEFSFTEVLPIDHPDTGNPLLYTGRLDAVLNFAGGHWGFDEKTTTSLGPTWGGKWGLRGQFLGYTWGCRQAGIPIKGIVVRGVSILKNSYDTAESINEYPDWMIDQWYVELLEYIDEAKRAYVSKRFRHNYGEACANYGGCQFRTICSVANQKPYLETHFERRHWDPVTRKETLITE
jgi:hypothetical protein